MRFNAERACDYVAGDLSDTLCGKTAVIEDGENRRLVTIGGVIQVDQKLYAMTAGLSSGAEEDLDSPSEIDSLDSDSFSGSDFDEDVEPALMFGNTSKTTATKPQALENYDKEHDPRASTSAALTFSGSSKQGDDWSLHLIEDPFLALPNVFPGADGISLSDMTHPAKQPVSSIVWLLTGVSGRSVHQMHLGTITFPSTSGEWLHVWKVSLANSTKLQWIGHCVD